MLRTVYTTVARRNDSWYNIIGAWITKGINF